MGKIATMQEAINVGGKPMFSTKPDKCITNSALNSVGCATVFDKDANQLVEYDELIKDKIIIVDNYIRLTFDGKSITVSSTYPVSSRIEFTCNGTFINRDMFCIPGYIDISNNSFNWTTLYNINECNMSIPHPESDDMYNYILIL